MSYTNNKVLTIYLYQCALYELQHNSLNKTILNGLSIPNKLQFRE